MSYMTAEYCKQDYLAEYTGDLISHREADKRGIIYDRKNSSFLFYLNDQSRKSTQKRNSSGNLCLLIYSLTLTCLWMVVLKMEKTRELKMEQNVYSTVVNAFLREYRDRLMFLDKGLLTPDIPKAREAAITQSQVGEANRLISLFPIWATSLIFGVIVVQVSTFFTKQGLTLDISIGPIFKIPAASLKSFVGICVIIFILIYDRLLVPLAKKKTGKPSRITSLQRIGRTGLFISIFCMIVAGFVENRRLEIAVENGFIDLPNMTIPMSRWWMLPQYTLCGISDTFTIVGFQELLYDQVPIEMRSVGIALYSSVFGIGSFVRLN